MQKKVHHRIIFVSKKWRRNDHQKQEKISATKKLYNRNKTQKNVHRNIIYVSKKN